MPVLRPYQEEAVARFAERIGQVPRGGLIVLGTGTGKSIVMAEIAKWWKENGKGGVGIGAIMEAVVDDWPQTYAFDHAADGLEIAEFAALLPAWITIVEQVG